MKVLIALDGSPCSEQAFNYILSSQWTEQTEFKIVSVVEPLAAQATGWHSAYLGPGLVDLERQMFEQTSAMIVEKVQTLLNEKHGVKASGEVLTGAIWQSIVEESKSWSADLIVLGSHGRSGLSKILLGSVAAAVAEHARCSVEIIKGVVGHGEDLAASTVAAASQA